MAFSLTHLSQKILNIFHKNSEEDVFVVKRRELMDPIEDKIHNDEGKNNALDVGREGDQDGAEKGSHEIEGPHEGMEG